MAAVFCVCELKFEKHLEKCLVNNMRHGNVRVIIITIITIIIIIIIIIIIQLHLSIQIQFGIHCLQDTALRPTPFL